MVAFINNVEGLIERRFPDALFERLSRQLGPDDEIHVVPEPESPREGGNENEQSCGPRSAARDSKYHMPDKTEDCGSAVVVPRRDEEQSSQARSDELSDQSRETKGIFSLLYELLLPRSSFPEPKSTIDEILHALFKGQSALYNWKKRKWKNWPKTSETGKENDVADFLNKVVEHACKYLNSKRHEDGAEELKPFIFSRMRVRRPAQLSGAKDQVPQWKQVIALRPQEKLSWLSVRGLGSLKPTTHPSIREDTEDIQEDVRLIFRSQRARRFVLCFGLYDTNMHLWKFDRSGFVASESFDVHEEPENFLRIVLGMALGEDYYLGYDPSFILKDGEEYIKLNRKEYRIIRTIYTEAAIRGRGTLVLLVEDPETSARLVVKEQWVDTSRGMKEFKMLGTLKEKNVENVPQLVAHQIVHFRVGSEGIVKDSTEIDRDRGMIKNEAENCHVETRDHYRLLISPYGDKLESFNSLKELVSAFWDCIGVIKRLNEESIVHRDVSTRNIVLVNKGDPLMRKGYLIDFDNAAEQSPQSKSAEAKRHGTFPFMACGVLSKRFTAHQYYHDLESLFYVLVWICLVQKGPWKQRRPDSELRPPRLPVHEWCRDRNSREIRETEISKWVMVITARRFRRRILNFLPEYFRPLENLLLGLRKIIFQQDLAPSEIDPMCKEDVEPISIDRRNSKDVFAELDDLFGRELAKLRFESSFLLVKEKTQPSTGQNASQDDAGIFMASDPFPRYVYMHRLNRMVLIQKTDLEANIVAPLSAPACFHTPPVLQSARSSRPSGRKRLLEDTEVLSGRSSPSTKRPRKA